MNKYTCCFLFDMDLESVLLIQKNHPDWQKGKLNGIGGKIEEGETPEECARREFREETGVDIDYFEKFAVLTDENSYEVHFYCALSQNGDFYKARAITDETIHPTDTEELPHRNCVDNVTFLVHMAISLLDFDEITPIKTIYYIKENRVTNTNSH